jgi:hypothetical protein
MKLVERMPRVCKAVIKARVATLKNLKYKIYLHLFNTFFGYYMIPYVSFHSFDVCTIIINVENSTNKEKPLIERCVQTFDWYCMYYWYILMPPNDHVFI